MVPFATTLSHAAFILAFPIPERFAVASRRGGGVSQGVFERGDVGRRHRGVFRTLALGDASGLLPMDGRRTVIAARKGVAAQGRQFGEAIRQESGGQEDRKRAKRLHEPLWASTSTKCARILVWWSNSGRQN